jgi:hypothetical protein
MATSSGAAATPAPHRAGKSMIAKGFVPLSGVKSFAIIENKDRIGRERLGRKP